MIPKFAVSLDVAARSRPAMLHDVAASQVREAGVAPVATGRTARPPAHGIRSAVLPLATIVVASLELHLFKAAVRVDARGHERLGQTHYDTRSEERRVGKEW